MEPVATWYLDPDGDVLDYEADEAEVRVKMYIDDHAETLDGQGDFLPLIVRVDDGYRQIEAGGRYAGNLDEDRIAYALGYLGDRLERWLRIFYNVSAVETWYDHGRWFAIATPEWVATLGDGADVKAALRQSVQFVTDWAEGNVFGYQVERRYTGSYRKEYDNGGTVRYRFDEWEETEDSCWGYVGWDWAEEHALEALRSEGKGDE